MNLQPIDHLSDEEINRGLKFVIKDGLMSETMADFTGGAFLVAMALLLGASNFEIGLLAALPTFTNVFQIISIWLVRRFNNRRLICVVCSLIARTPLLLVGCMLLIFSTSTTIEVVIFFLFFYYLFGSISGPSWNSWMKDLVSEKRLGTFFSHRSRLNQMLDIILNLAIALMLDYVKKNYPQYQLYAYGGMFVAGAIAGIISAYFLSKTPEPKGIVLTENIFRLILQPLKNNNFRRLIIFNAAWAFAFNIAAPFFTVFLLKSMDFPLSYIIVLGIISQIGGILTIRLWGKYSDKYSNKTIIALCAPLYTGCLIAWCFVGLYTHLYVSIALLILIYIFTGISTAGINLSLTNIGLKLAPERASIAYLSAKNIISGVFSSIAPVIGGYLADYFTKRHLYIRLEWGGPRFTKTFRLIELHEWNFLFLISALFTLIAIELLMQVNESGEVDKEQVRRILHKSVRGSLKQYYLIGHLLEWQSDLLSIIRKHRPYRPSPSSEKDSSQ